jgi:hypothetical protein
MMLSQNIPCSNDVTVTSLQEIRPQRIVAAADAFLTPIPAKTLKQATA